MHKLQFYCPNLVKIALAHPSITGKAYEISIKCNDTNLFIITSLKPLLDMPALASFKAFSCTLDDAFVTELTRTKPHLKELLISWNECPLHVSSFIGFKGEESPLIMCKYIFIPQMHFIICILSGENFYIFKKTQGKLFKWCFRG